MFLTRSRRVILLTRVASVIEWVPHYLPEGEADQDGSHNIRRIAHPLTMAQP